MYLLVLSPRQLRKYFKEDIVRDLLTSTTAQEELEAEWLKLSEDREAVRAIFPTGNSKVSYVSVHVIKYSYIRKYCPNLIH